MFYMKFMRYAVIAISFMSGINLHAMNNNQPQRSSSPTNLTDLFLALALNESRPNETGNNNRNNNTILPIIILLPIILLIIIAIIIQWLDTGIVRMMTTTVMMTMTMIIIMALKIISV